MSNEFPSDDARAAGLGTTTDIDRSLPQNGVTFVLA